MNQKNTEYIGNEHYEEIYEKVLTLFNNDIDKMYEAFKWLCDYLVYFGDTKEKRMKNYCRFKSDNVINRLL